MKRTLNLFTALSLMALSSLAQTAGQFIVPVRTATGQTPHGVTLSNGQVIGKSGGVPAAITPSASLVGLGNVDNTSDANKPISTATQTALNLKANVTALETLNVKLYGAKGDAVMLTDAVVTNSDATVTSASASWTSADIGKIIYATNASGAVILNSTIASINSGTSIEATAVATGSQTGASLVYGTDDTAALKAAGDAAAAGFPCGAVVIPAGGYIFDETPFIFASASARADGPAIVGAGSGVTTLYPHPTFTPTSASILLTDGNNNHMTVQGFRVEGLGVDHSAAISRVMLVGSGNTDLTDLHFKSLKTSEALLIIQATTYARQLHLEYNAGSRAVHVNAATASFTDCYAGNCGTNTMLISNGGKVLWQGGILDESSTDTVELTQTSTLMLSSVTQIWSFAGTNAVALRDTSSLRAVNCPLWGPYYGRANAGALRLHDSGTTARLLNCALSHEGTGYALNNSGAVHDLGGNTFSNTTGTAAVTPSGTPADGSITAAKLANSAVDLAGAKITGVLAAANGGTGGAAALDRFRANPMDWNFMWGSVSTTGTSGSGGNSPSNHSINVTSGATASSRGMATIPMTNTATFLGPHDADYRYLDFSKRVTVGTALAMIQATSAGTTWIKIGQGASTAGDLAARGLQLKIANLTLTASCHNGTSLTTSSTLATLTASRGYYLILQSDGAGGVGVYLNNALVATLTGGPTSATTSQFEISVECTNGADSATQRAQVSPVKVVVAP